MFRYLLKIIETAFELMFCLVRLVCSFVAKIAAHDADISINFHNIQFDFAKLLIEVQFRELEVSP